MFALLSQGEKRVSRTYEVLAKQYAEENAQRSGYVAVQRDPVADWDALCEAGYIQDNRTEVNFENVWIEVPTPAPTQGGNGNGIARLTAIGGLVMLGFQVWDEFQKHSRN